MSTTTVNQSLQDNLIVCQFDNSPAEIATGTPDDLRSPTIEETPPPVRIDALRSSLSRWLSIPKEDADLIDFCLAVYKSHEIDGDPLWGCIIDASGAGKTELLRAFRNRSDAYFLSSLTEKTLVSGYRDPEHPEKDPSLLPQIHGKVLFIKDLSPLLSMRRESRNAILGQLRDAYDGFTDQGRGNVGKVTYESRFSLLTASTLAIERFDTVDQELGERFIKFRARGNDSRSKVRRAIRNIGADGSMRREIEQAISEFLDSLPSIVEMEIPEALQERLAELADSTARARSHVARDRGGDIQYLPKPEVGTRLGKELGKLLLVLAAVRGKVVPDEQDFATVQRVAEDCLPPNRLAVINALRGSTQPLGAADVEKTTALPRTTAARTLEDLKALGVADKVETEHEQTALWGLVSCWKAAP
jgi:hypothetical protein